MTRKIADEGWCDGQWRRRLNTVVVVRSNVVDDGATTKVMMGYGEREVSQRGRIGDLSLEKDGGRLVVVGFG
jgi:hypothetical protein